MAAKGLMTFEKLSVRLGELENRREATARRLQDVRNPQKRILVFTLLFATTAGFGVLLASAILMRFFALGAWAALYARVLPDREIRTTGMGGASGMARVAGILAPTLGGIMIGLAATATGSLVSAVSLWAAAFMVGGITVFLLSAETKHRALSDTVSDPEGA